MTLALAETPTPPTQGTLRTTDGQSLPLLQTGVSARIDGVLANVIVTQTFKNTRSEPIEAVYSFPLPHGASVWRLEFKIADRVVKGVIKERAEARRAYQAAKAEGRAATLLEEDAPSIFTLSVANVAAGAEIIVHLEYQEVVGFEDGRFVFVFPMVAPDLYRDGGSPGAADALPPPRMLSPERNADVGLEIRIAPTPVSTRPDNVIAHAALPVTEVQGRSHFVQPEVEPNGTTVVRIGGPGYGRIPNRDFVLEWQEAKGGVQPVLRVEPPVGPDERGTFLLTLAPSRADAKVDLKEQSGEARPIRCGNCGAGIDDAKAIVEIAGFGTLVKCKHCGAMLAPATSPVIRASRERDVAILFDRSASMRLAMPQAREMVMAVVDALLPGDAVAAIAFDHDRTIFDELRWLTAGPDVSRRIAAFLEAPARGGSDLTKALEAIAKLPAREGRTRAVVLVTDGAVGNTAKLLRRVPEILGKSTRLHVLGVGAAVNRYFVETLARAGGGAATIVTPKDNVKVARERFARKVIDGGPVLTDVTLSWEGATVSALHPNPPPDLYGNEPLHIVGRYTGTGPAKLVVTARTPAGTPFRQEIEVVLPAPALEAPVATTPRLERVWANAEVKKLIAEDEKSAALFLALEHSLATPLTSLIAEDSEVSVEKKRIPKAHLRVRKGTHVGSVYELSEGTTRLGRLPPSDIILESGNVSRVHCEIIVDTEGYRVRDHSSTNGTYVNGARVRERVLEEDAVLYIGDTQLVFEYVRGETIGILPTKTLTVAEELDPHAAEEVRTAARDVDLSFAAPPRMARPARAEDDLDGLDENMMRTAARTRGYGGPSPMAPLPRPAAGMPLPAPAPMMRSAASMPPAPPARGGSAGHMPPPAAPRGAPQPMLAGAGFAPPPGAARAEAPPPMLGASLASHPADDDGPTGANRIESLSSYEPAPMPGAVRPMAMPMPPAVTLKAPTHPAGAPARRASRPHHDDATDSTRDTPNVLRAADRYTPLRDDSDDDDDAPTVPPPRRPEPVVNVWTAPPAQIPQAPAILPTGPAYPEAELTFVKHRIKGQLDLALLVDATDSMAPYIATVKQRMRELLTAVAASPLCKDFRVAIVSYRDHPPEEPTYVSRVDLAFSGDVQAALAAVEKLVARGGGDHAEAVTDGLHDVVRLDWRPDAAKAVVWFGDAPPHGVGARTDNFPNGCPCGNDWFAQAEACREMGIAIYALGCLPTIRLFTNGEQVYRTIARATNGMYLALHEAELLVPLIAGAAETALDEQRIDEHVVDLAAKHTTELEATDDVERARWLLSALHHANIERLKVDERGKRAFHALVQADVDAALNRLRAQQRVAW